MSERPAKRARLELAKTFLDLEADDACVSDDDQEPEEDDKEVGEDEDLPDDGSHCRLQLAIEASTHNVSWDWDEFLARAKKRGQTTIQESTVESIGEERMLWEVGCRIGCEESLAFTLLQQALTSLTLAQRVQSVVGRASRPARIYIEANERCTVEELVKGVANINARDIKPVADHQLEDVLREPPLPSISSQSWVRIRHGGTLGRRYEGDIGFVLTDERDFEIAIIPRTQDTRAPLSMSHLPQDLPAFNGRYQWKGRDYTDSGFLVAKFERDQLHLDYHHATVPNRQELQAFHHLKELGPHALKSCFSAMDQQNLKIFDKVKVISGELCHLIGEIHELTHSEATVYISSQDCSYTVPLYQLRVHYQVGDAVRVVKGQHQGSWGWITNVGVYLLDIFVCSRLEEISVDPLNVEYHTPESTSLRTIRSQGPILPLGNRKHVHRGKEVIVVKKHAYKGYHGIIKDVLCDNIARVELFANTKMVELPLKNLALTSHHRHILAVINGETTLDRQAIDLRNAHACDTSIHRRRTPTPIPEDQTAMNNAWVPDSSDTTIGTSDDLWADRLAHIEKTMTLGGSQVSHPSRPMRIQIIASWEDTRQVPGVHWLMHPALQGLRLKLYDIEDEGRVILEYKGFDKGGVIVRRRLDPRALVPAARIRAVYPSQASQLVTPLDREDVGEIFQVLSFDSWRCTLRNVDKSLSKKSREKTVITVLLIEIFPNLK